MESNKSKRELKKDGGVGERRRLFVNLAVGALTKKRSHLLIALASVIIGATVISSMSSVYLDIVNKMNKELRSYGANLVILPISGGQDGGFSELKLTTPLKKIPADKLVGVAPYLYNIGDVISGSKLQRVVIAGTDFTETEKVSPYWKVDGALPEHGDDALIGIEVAEKLGLKPGDSIAIRQTGAETVETNAIHRALAAIKMPSTLQRSGR